MIPKSKPQATSKTVIAAALKAFKAAGRLQAPSLYVVGVRGYYLDSMGRVGINDRGIYDDAIFIVSPNVFASFNANVDPSVFRPGIATLAPGVHTYRKGNHGISRPGGGYPAFRPATKNEELPVTRDGVSANPRPGVAINIHRGGNNGTSSEGCQTLPPKQWDAFYQLLSNEMARTGCKTFDYVLLTERIS